MGVEITSETATIFVAILGTFATCFTFMTGKKYEKKMDLKKSRKSSI